MTHEERERLLRLQAAEMHEAVDTTPGIEVQFINDPDYGAGPDFHYCEAGRFYATINEHPNSPKLYVEHEDEWMFLEINEIDTLIALLQRARQIMGGQ